MVVEGKDDRMQTGGDLQITMTKVGDATPDMHAANRSKQFNSLGF